MKCIGEQRSHQFGANHTKQCQQRFQMVFSTLHMESNADGAKLNMPVTNQQGHQSCVLLLHCVPMVLAHFPLTLHRPPQRPHRVATLYSNRQGFKCPDFSLSSPFSTSVHRIAWHQVTYNRCLQRCSHRLVPSHLNVYKSFLALVCLGRFFPQNSLKLLPNTFSNHLFICCILSRSFVAFLTDP